MQRHPVFERLVRGQPIVLDGDVAHELARRGYHPSGALGDAAAAREAPALLAQAHRAFVDAGCDVLLAYTARTSVRQLARGGFGMRAAAVTNQAVDIALEAAQSATDRPVAVAGVLGTLLDDDDDDERNARRASEPPAPLAQPSARQLADEHAEQATRLAVAGCDAVVVAPMPTLRETLAATAAARRVIETVWTVLALGGRAATQVTADGALELTAAALLLAAAGAQAVLLESASPTELTAALATLATANLGVHLGARLVRGTEDGAAPGASADHFAGELLASARHGARVLGGAAGARPDDVRALARVVRQRVAA